MPLGIEKHFMFKQICAWQQGTGKPDPLWPHHKFVPLMQRGVPAKTILARFSQAMGNERNMYAKVSMPTLDANPMQTATSDGRAPTSVSHCTLRFRGNVIKHQDRLGCRYTTTSKIVVTSVTIRIRWNVHLHATSVRCRHSIPLQTSFVQIILEST